MSGGSTHHRIGSTVYIFMARLTPLFQRKIVINRERFNFLQSAHVESPIPETYLVCNPPKQASRINAILDCRRVGKGH